MDLTGAFTHITKDASANDVQRPECPQQSAMRLEESTAQ
jgi:hypothetical protein